MSKIKPIKRLRRLYYFWLSFLIMMFFAEITIDVVKSFFSGVLTNPFNAVWVMVAILVSSGLLAILSLFWPGVERILGVMFGESEEV